MPSRYGHHDNHHTILQPWSICSQRRQEIVITGFLRFLHAPKKYPLDKLPCVSTRWRHRRMIQHPRPGIYTYCTLHSHACLMTYADDHLKPTLHGPVTRRCTTKRRGSPSIGIVNVYAVLRAPCAAESCQPTKTWRARWCPGRGVRHTCRNRNC